MSGKPRSCGCKGYRSCLLCEQEFNLQPFQEDQFTAESLKEHVSTYCILLGKRLKCKKYFRESLLMCFVPLVIWLGQDGIVIHLNTLIIVENL